MPRYAYGSGDLFGRPRRARRPKRTRYYADVTKPSGKRETVTCLAYDPDFLRKGCEAEGYIVHYSGTAMPTPEDGGFVIDQEALATAIELLDLTLPVEVLVKDRATAMGSHQFWPVGGQARIVGHRWRDASTADTLTHRIILNPRQTAEKASHTLWHELTHAVQAERVLAAADDPTDFNAVMIEWTTAYFDGTRYAHKPYEVEANATADEHADLPLTTPRRPR